MATWLRWGIGIGLATAAVALLLPRGGAPPPPSTTPDSAPELVAVVAESTAAVPVWRPRRVGVADLPGLRLRAAEDEADLAVRRDLLTGLLIDRSEGGQRERQALIGWFLQHHPADPVLATPYGILHGLDPSPEHAAALARWDALSGAEDPPDQVLANAAAWQVLSDPDAALGLYDRLQRRDPANPEWHRQEGHLHMLEVDPADGLDDADREAAGYALEAQRRALLLVSPEGRPGLLGEAMKSAGLVGDWEQAEDWARELLSTARDDLNGGHARFDGHQGLGLARLHAGDLEGAVAELLQLKDLAPGAVQQSFGPPMLLAAELLERGETGAVLAYLATVETYWEPETIAGWRAVIESGGIPDFGGNLRY